VLLAKGSTLTDLGEIRSTLISTGASALTSGASQGVGGALGGALGSSSLVISVVS